MKKDSGQANSRPDGAAGMTNSKVKAFAVILASLARRESFLKCRVIHLTTSKLQKRFSVFI